jgi:hypothetical protein
MGDMSREEVIARFDAIENRMDGKFAGIEAKMATHYADMVKWVVGTVIAGGTVTVTILAFLLNNSMPRTVSAPSAAPQPPIVIHLIPPSATPPK